MARISWGVVNDGVPEVRQVQRRQYEGRLRGGLEARQFRRTSMKADVAAANCLPGNTVKSEGQYIYIFTYRVMIAGSALPERAAESKHQLAASFSLSPSDLNTSSPSSSAALLIIVRHR